MAVEVRLPVNASAERTEAVLQKVSEYLRDKEGHLVDHVLTINGFNFAGRGQNAGLVLIMLKDWSVKLEAKTSLAWPSAPTPTLPGSRMQP